MREGSNELNSPSRRDHFSICYLGVLTFAGETVGKLSVPVDEMFPILRPCGDHGAGSSSATSRAAHCRAHQD